MTARMFGTSKIPLAKIQIPVQLISSCRAGNAHPLRAIRPASHATKPTTDNRHARKITQPGEKCVSVSPLAFHFSTLPPSLRSLGIILLNAFGSHASTRVHTLRPGRHATTRFPVSSHAWLTVMNTIEHSSTTACLGIQPISGNPNLCALPSGFARPRAATFLLFFCEHSPLCSLRQPRFTILAPWPIRPNALEIRPHPTPNHRGCPVR